MDLWDTIASERLQLADELDKLTPAQWAAPTGCDGWTVKHVVAHLVTGFEVSLPRFMLTMARHRFRLNVANDVFAAKLARRSTTDLVRTLRENADNRFTPPRARPVEPLSEIVIHGQDIRTAIQHRRVIRPDILDTILSATSGAIRADYQHRATQQAT